RLLALGQNLGHADQRELLAMADLAARILAPALLERDDLRPARLLEHLGGDHRAGHSRHTDRHSVAADEQDLAELDNFTGFALDLVDLEHVFGGYPVLLAARLE